MADELGNVTRLKKHHVWVKCKECGAEFQKLKSHITAGLWKGSCAKCGRKAWSNTMYAVFFGK